MDFLKLIQSLDALLYEVMSWLIFYPKTLVRTLVRPLEMMAYADVELAEDAGDDRYADALSPPLFLLLTLALMHAGELATVGEDPAVTSTRGLNALISDDTNLVVLKLALFSIYPLVMAARLVRLQGRTVTRETLRPPFYSQCYVTAVLAILMSLGELLAKMPSLVATGTGLAAVVVGLVWFGTLQILWFRRYLATGWLRAIWNASVAMVQALVAVALVGLLFA